MIPELLGAPAVVDHNLATFMTRLAPVVDCLAVVANDVTMTRSVGVHRATVVEFESLTATSRPGDDLESMAILFKNQK